MPLVVACPSCTSKLKAPENLVGKKVKCPKCGNMFIVAVEEPEVVAAKLDEDEMPARRRRRPETEEDEEAGYEEDDDSDEDEEEEDGEPRPRKRRRQRYDAEAGHEGGRQGLAGLSSNYSIDAGEWFRYANAHFSAVLLPMIGFTLIYGGILFVLGWLSRLSIFLFLLMPIAQALVVYPLSTGFIIVALAQLKGKRWNFGDFFSGFKWFGPLLVSSLLLIPGMLGGMIPGALIGAIIVGAGAVMQQRDIALVGVMLGATLASLGGLFVVFRLGIFAGPMIVDRGCGPIEALKANWKVTEGHFWGLLGMMLLLGLVYFAGAMCFGIGLLVTMPYVVLIYCAGYLLAAGSKRPLSRPRE